MARSEREADVSNFVTTWTVDNPPYVILKWTIENLCHAETLLKSPSFDISQTSKWNLLLDPNIVVEQDQFIGIFLKNNNSDTGRFMLKGELSVHGPNNELIYDKLFDEIYGGRNGIEFRLAKVVFPVQSCVEDSYLVRCEMVITREIDTVDISRSHLQKLSLDYKKLYHDNKYTDISIRAIDDIICSHKAFLHARSSYFAKKLAENVTYLTENDEKNPHMAVVLLFLYTGDPDLLLSSVPLEMFGRIYQLAKKWQLNELVNLLTPLKMHCRTHVKNECFQYTWEIKNFTKLSAESSGVLHSSEFFTKEKFSAKWRLTLEKHLRDGGDVEFYGLYLEKINSDNSSYKTNAEFRIYNNRGNPILKRREYKFGPRANQKCGFSSLFDKHFVQGDSAQEDTLKIICILKIRLDSDSWIDFKSTSVDVSDKDTCFLKYLKILSSNFKELYESQKYTDLKLFAGEEMISVHKAVLWARSPYFTRILSQYSAEYVAVDVQHDILKEILLYMYTAEIPTLTPLNMQKMYQASFLLQLQELWLLCKSYILLHITVDNVLELMVLAHKYDNEELKEATEKFASTPGNAKMFLNTQRWKNFREKHITLAIIIYHNLSWSFCNNF